MLCLLSKQSTDDFLPFPVRVSEEIVDQIKLDMSKSDLKKSTPSLASRKPPTIEPGLVDPRSLGQVGVYNLMKPLTFKKYLKTWNDFCDQMAITTNSPPVEENFLTFFEKLKGMHLNNSKYYTTQIGMGKKIKNFASILHQMTFYSRI